MAGVFYPAPEGLLPLDWKRQLFDRLSAEINRQMKRPGVSEEEIV
jgi:hypothetical protein